MTLHDTLWCVACAFLAEVIGTMAGFGAATILTPIAALFLDMKTRMIMILLALMGLKCIIEGWHGVA